MSEFAKRITKKGQNEGNYAKIKEILLQSSCIWGEMLAIIIRRGLSENIVYPSSCTGNMITIIHAPTLPKRNSI